MGDQVKVYRSVGDIPVEPTGDLLTDGWLPGTWVVWSPSAPTFPGVMATVDRSNGTENLIAGFLQTGPQHNQPVIELSDMWTTDTRQVPGGDTHADWSSFDAGGSFVFDSNKQLQRMGSRVVSMHFWPPALARFYCFETLSYSERHGGGGGALTYTEGDRLYISENGLLTNEQETLANNWTELVVIDVANDIEGDSLLIGTVLPV